MARIFHAAVLCVLALPALALAQTAPVLFDAADLAAKLNIPPTHDAATARLKEAGEEALVPLWEIADRKETPENVRKDILDAFPDIYKRLRAARAGKEAALAKAWNQKLVEDYNQFGQKDARWDALAVAALTDAGNDSAMLPKLKAARDAGCNDPLIRLLEMIALQETGKIDIPHAARDYPGIVGDMAASKYPDAIKFLAYARLVKQLEEPGINKATGTEALAKAIQLMPAFFAEKPGAAREEGYLRRMLSAPTGVQFNHKATYDDIAAALGKAVPDGWQVKAFKGWFYIEFGFDARGGGSAASVSDLGWIKFNERVEVAREALEDGWRKDPLNSCCAAAMISVCNYQDIPRERMESWFQKAMLADPDCYQACANKLDYLTPKWHGSQIEMLAFGRECVKIGNGRNDIPGILLLAVKEVGASDPSRPIDTNLAERYMRLSQVWADVKSACEKLLADKTDLTYSRDQYLRNRGLYLRLACQCGQWEKVVSLAKEFGDELDLNEFGGKPLYDYYMAKAREIVAK